MRGAPQRAGPLGRAACLGSTVFRSGANTMQRTLLAGLLGLTFLAVPAWAMMIAPPVISQRVAAADAIVVGKVTGFADKSVTAVRYPGGTDKVNYQIAL